MRFSYSPQVDILTLCASEGAYGYGEDNEGVIAHHGLDGSPLSLEILDAKLFVMFANASVVSGKEVTNPDVSQVPYTRDRNVQVRTVPTGDADLRFKYHAGSDTLTVRLGAGDSDTCRRNHAFAVYYDQNELPTGLEVENAREFVLGIVQSVLFHKEVTVA